jgi:hypothetical protein
MQKQTEEKTSRSKAGVAIKILLMVLILPIVIPGFLLSWSMGAQSWMERLGYAKPTYSEYALCEGCGDIGYDEKKRCVLIGECYGRIRAQDCKQQDLMLDGGDGPHKGKVRWSVCWGIDCGENWETGVTPQQKNSGLTDVIAFCFVALLLILFIVLPTVLVIRLVLGIFSSKIRMGIRARPFLHILGAIFFTILIFPFLFIERIQMPADADVTDHFYKHKSEFAELAEMLSEDSQIQYISESLVLTCGSPDTERFNLYQDLMNQTELFGLRSNSGPPRQISFLRRDCYPNAKFVKGYVYSNSEPQNL